MPSEGPHRDGSKADGLPSAGDASLEEVLDRYLQELGEGRSPDQQSYLRAHPELADALRGVFRTLDFIEATGRSLNASTLQTGQQLGEYRIVREVGRGGMGVVYEAIQTSLDRQVALKILPTGAVLSGTAPERFTREAAMAGRLQHTNIVPVYAIGEEQGILFYAMQFIEGRSLAQHLKLLRQAGTAPGHDYFKRVARWGQQVAGALEYAHGEGTIHRDIKPSNLLLDHRDNVWVTDFGLARADALATLTVSGDVIGTARYMSPEQARGGRTHLDEGTDIYSVGATLYELLALTPPFDGESREAVLNLIAFADPKPLRQLSRAVPRELETIVGKCMEKERERRYRRAEDIAEDCRRFLAGEPIRARRTPAVAKAARWLRRRRYHVMGAAAIVMLAVASMVLLAKVRHERGQRHLNEAFTTILFDHDAQRASRLLDEASDAGVDSARLHLCRGLVPLLTNQPHRAFAHLERILQRDPGHVEAGLALALAYNASGDFVNGRRVLQRGEEREIDTALGWLLRGLALSKTDRSEAIESYNRAIALRGDFTPAISARANYRGVRLLSQGNRAELDPMLNDYDALVVFRPNSTESYAGRANGWLIAAAYAATQVDLRGNKQRWLGNCESDLTRAEELGRGDDSLIFVRRGVYLRYIGDFEGSAEAFGDAIALDRLSTGTTHPYRLHERAVSLYALGEFPMALEEIIPACEAMPSYCPLLLQRALLLAELGSLDEARAVCRESMRRQSFNASGLFLSAAVMDLLGDAHASADAINAFADERVKAAAGEDAGEAAYALALEYLAGRLDASALLVAAKDDPGRRCEFAFLVALRRLARGDREGGLASLRTCLDTGVFIFTEYRFAQAMLARARSSAEWPLWLSAGG